MAAATASVSSGTSPAVRTAPNTLAQMRATVDLTGRITPDDLTPQMRQEFIELYRRWQAGDE